MEITSNSFAGQEIAVNRAQAGNEILQKTLQKTEESREAGQSPERPQTERPTNVSNKRVDIYA